VPLESGFRIGQYEIAAEIGRGGMGEVYRARDTVLNRDVAIKVLPSPLALDPERLARLRREAQLLASLNHPNIAQIHGLEQTGATTAIVMELVDGPTLADRITSGALPLDEVLPIARQIADALIAAHEQGIIHRDLKPTNVKVRADGTVKVLDFGLAKSVDDQTSDAPRSSALVTASPTITTPAMTQVGVILGTAAYMSPEQAKGRAADKRSDVWAFGCIVYEMLTAKRAFAGEDVGDTLAAVIRGEPDWTALPADLPRPLRGFIQGCLEKDRGRRVGHISTARFALDERTFERPATTPAETRPPRSVWRRVVALTAVAILITALTLVAAMYAMRSPPESRTMRFAVSPPDRWSLSSGTRFGGVAAAPLAVAPNGRLVAVLARNADGRDRLWVRSLDSLVARELPGTDGAIGPFWSPDSEWLGFYADGSLKKVAVSGGVPIPLCRLQSFNSGSWGRDGVIVFGLGLGRGGNPIKRVLASGGVVTDATVLVKGDTNQLRPAFLPDGRHFLFRVNSGVNTGYFVTALDSNERTRVLGGDVGNVVFAGEHLLFLRDTTLMAQKFDVDRLALEGDPVPIADHIATAAASNVGTFSASSTILAYQTETGGGGSRLTWFSRDGKALETVSDRADYTDLALSPEGKRALVSVSGPGTRDIWLVDLVSRMRTRFTFDPAEEQQSVWFSKGRRVIFGSNRNGRRDLYQKDANALGAEELLYADNFDKSPLSVSTDEQLLLYSSGEVGKANDDLWVLPLSGSHKPRLALGSTPSDERDGRFSPDGHLIAYTSDESGTTEVYVARFPGPGGKRQISTNGGSGPTWSANGREIFYLDRDERLFVADVSVRDGFTAENVRPLFPIQRGGQRRVYDVSPDGTRILVNTADVETPSPFTVVVNWAAGLTK
jgi:serine/threonine protein kinase/Tol biopolymer transport system component